MRVWSIRKHQILAEICSHLHRHRNRLWVWAEYFFTEHKLAMHGQLAVHKKWQSYQIPYRILQSFSPSFQAHVRKLLSTLHCWCVCMFFSVLFWPGIRKVDSRFSYNKMQQKTLRMAAKGKYNDPANTCYLVHAEDTWGSGTYSEHTPAPVWISTVQTAGKCEDEGSGEILVHPIVPLQYGVEMGLSWGCPD